MSAESDHTGLESLLAEMRAAEQAGVFAPTRLDFSALAEPPASSRVVRFYERALVGVPVAACVAAVIGIATMSGGPVGEGPLAGGVAAVSPSPLAVSNGQADSLPCSVEIFAQCVAGPGEPVNRDCGCADLDRDGDVDLADVGSFQMLAANVR